jgi:hypothetical protein
MPQCVCMKTNGEQCSKNATRGDEYCKYHRRIVNNRNERVAVDTLMIDLLNQIWGHGVRDEGPLIARIDEAFRDGLFSEEWRHRLIQEMRDELQVMIVMEQPLPNQTELQRLANDTQNVHTGPVNRQTKANEDLLLKISVPKHPNTILEITSRMKFPRVVKDVKKWYNVTSCRSIDDYLYRRLLDGLWIHIQTSEHKEELVKRLQEEMIESIGKCCEGHISRLCNVLVGFDDSFKPVVSTGELLQQKLAAIAERDIQVEYKVGEAWSIFDELGIPIEERNAWIEAF